MAIDSVGGGGPRDTVETMRARKLQEERAEKLRQLEENSREDIAKAQKARADQLEQIYQSQEREIAERRNSADQRVEQAQEVADSRIKSFERDSQKMTDEAKRQFQAKAQSLQRSAKELENQRTALLKSHEAAMDRIRANSENNQQEATLRASSEAAKAHLNQQRRIEDINARGEFEASRIQGEVDDHKREIVSEGARKLSRLEQQQKEDQGVIEAQIDFGRRAGEAQMMSEREKVKGEQAHLAQEADDRMTRMALENQRALNRSHFEGNRKLFEEQSKNMRELSDVTKDAHNQIREVQSRAAFNMASITAEAEAQEAIARRAYAQQKEALSGERDKNIAMATQQNESLQKKLQADYNERSKAFAETKNKMLLSQLEVDEAELKTRRDDGRRQINAQIAANAKKIAEHGSKDGDSFYRAHVFGVRMEDSPLETVVHVPVPEHEQDAVRLTLQRGELCISGTRHHDEKLTTDDGHSVTTKSYQSYSESLPVKGKLEMREMTKTYADGVLTFRIPKG